MAASARQFHGIRTGSELDAAGSVFALDLLDAGPKTIALFLGGSRRVERVVNASGSDPLTQLTEMQSVDLKAGPRAIRLDGQHGRGELRAGWTGI